MNLPWDTFGRVTPPIRPDAYTSSTEHSQACKPIIVGAGLAGCWLARTLAERGVSVNLIDQHDTAANGASGNPAGIVKPFVTRAPCQAMQFYALAHEYLLKQLEKLGFAATGFHPCGVAQLVHRAYPQSEQYQCLNKSETDLQIGYGVQSQSIYFAGSGWLNPATLCHALIDHPLITLKLKHKLSSISLSNAADNTPVWSVNIDKHCPLECKHLVLANGESLSMLAQTRDLPVVPARGQLSRFEIDPANTAPRCVVSGKHYVIPDGDTVLVGASFERGNSNSAILPQEHVQNRAALQTLLPALSVNPDAIGGSAGVRATTPDRLPLIGPAYDLVLCNTAYAQLRHGNPHIQYPPLPTINGLYVLGGFGSRGIVTAALGANLLADQLMNVDSMSVWAPLLNPARFLIRRLKRGLSDTQ